MEPELRIFETAEKVAEAAADDLVKLTRARPEGEFSLCLSGGRTPLYLYRLLADHDRPWRSDMPWDQMAVFWGDERWVPHDHPDSNFGGARREFLCHVPIPEERLHAFDTLLPAPPLAAQAMQEQLKRCFGLKLMDGAPRMDCCLLGLGADGHTASLFPDARHEFEPGTLAAAVRVERLDAWRLTLTPAVFNAARTVLFMVTGADKARALKLLLAGPAEGAPPAAFIRPKHGNLIILADKAAAEGA